MRNPSKSKSEQNENLTKAGKKDSPKTIFLARDVIFFKSKGCKSKDEAIEYIKLWSGNGFVEEYTLNNGFYEFSNAEFIGNMKKCTSKPYPMGEKLFGMKIMEFVKDIILSYKD